MGLSHPIPYSVVRSVIVPIELIGDSLSVCFASDLIRAAVYRENLRCAA
jgi:hypothetical protein